MIETKRIFVIADLHFGHKKIIEFGRDKNFEKTIIENWNNTVTKYDTVIVLGDFALCPHKNFKRYVKKLNGHKILVIGNHDKESPLFYMKRGFDFACESFIYNNMLFSHEPMQMGNGIYRIFNKNKHIRLNIHGHIHDKPYPRRFKNKLGIYKNVSADVIRFTPMEISF